jgi:hypothetical protein
MNDKVFYWGSVVLGSLAVLLLVANVCLIDGNRSLQAEIGRRQGLIGNSVNLSNLNQSLVQALAQIAVDDNDQDVRELLAGQGITIKKKADAPAAATDTPAK